MSKESDHARQTGPAVEAMYQFNSRLVSTVERLADGLRKAGLPE